MIFIILKTIEDAKKLARICEKYEQEMNVDVITSRYILDGASLFCLMSILGKVVELRPDTDDYLLKTYFLRDIEKLGGYEVRLDG